MFLFFLCVIILVLILGDTFSVPFFMVPKIFSLGWPRHSAPPIWFSLTWQYTIKARTTLVSLPGGKSKSVELEDVKFHQCVRLSRFENDRTISFIPPDGEFELMSYRLNTHVSLFPVLRFQAKSLLCLKIKLKGCFQAGNSWLKLPTGL